MNNNKMFGEKIEKNIRYSEATDTYYVQFNFSPTNDAHLRGFPTLEDARQYRDAINAEKLKYKTEKDLAIIRKQEIKEIKKLVPYPYNAFEITKLPLKEIDNYFIDHFEGLLFEACSEKEMDCIIDFFKNNYTLDKLGKKYGVTKERIRQIIAVGMRKAEHYIYSYEAKQKIERDFADRHAFREQLIEEYKKNGVITPEMNFEFGELIVGEYHYGVSATIDDLDLSVRSYNCLIRAGIKYIKELVNLTWDEVLSIKNMGQKSAKEIRSKLQEMNLDFSVASVKENKQS